MMLLVDERNAVVGWYTHDADEAHLSHRWRSGNSEHTRFAMPVKVVPLNSIQGLGLRILSGHVRNMSPSPDHLVINPEYMSLPVWYTGEPPPPATAPGMALRQISRVLNLG